MTTTAPGDVLALCRLALCRLALRQLFTIALLTLLSATNLTASENKGEAENKTESFTACAASFDTHQGNADFSYCFFQVAQRERSFGEGIEFLQALLAKNPENPWLHLALGHLHWSRSPAQAEDEYGTAADGFKSAGEVVGEGLARENLSNLLFQQGHTESAETQLELLLSLADASRNPEVEARAWIAQAKRLRKLGFDRENVYRLLRQAEEKIFPNGPYRLQRGGLIQLGAVTYELGRYDEALEYYRRIAALAAEAGDAFGTASFLYNVANTRLAQWVEAPTATARSELVESFRESLQAATEAGHQSVEIQSHRILGNLLSVEKSFYEQAECHFERCRELARDANRSRLQAGCLRALGGHRVRWQADGARELLQEAQELARKSEDPWVMAQVEEQRMRLLWATEPREKALKESLAALQTIESLRSRQRAESGRANFFSLWTDPYYWLSGRLLENDSLSPEQNHGPAFQLAEQLRARVLLEALDTSGAGTTSFQQDVLVKTRNDLVNVQRRLLTPDTQESERQSLLLDLEELEWAEAEALASHSEATEPDFSSLQEIQNSLAGNEALFTFQVALWQDIYADFAGGAWLFVVTQNESRIYRLPDRARLRPAIRLFRSLVERRDGSEGPAAAALYRDLLAPALADLPSTIERLILVPDDDLHLLPWAVLSESPQAPSLAERFQLSLAPSATLWQHFRERAQPIQRGVLTFADPRSSAGPAEQPAATRTWALATGTRLGALPHARREGRAAVRSLGGSSHLLTGPEATEHALKAMDLAPFGLLHFATHAVVDEQHAQRSAVLLAPGNTGEDGLLQPRDIARLDLAGQAVVLSACQSATGEVLRGEGVLSLARPFFQAGANAVVGSLWPLRDDEAAQLFEAFYRHLARGKSLEAALANAQSDLNAEGAPAAAWSGLAVLGDGTLVPIPGGRSRLFLWGPRLGLFLLGFLLFALTVRLWRRG